MIFEHFIDFLSNFEMAITIDGDVLRRRFFNRWKAETLSFSICSFLLNLDLKRGTKSRFRIGICDFGNFAKLIKMQFSQIKFIKFYQFVIFTEFPKSKIPKFRTYQVFTLWRLKKRFFNLFDVHELPKNATLAITFDGDLLRRHHF